MNLFEQQANEFAGRHIGPDESETSGMLAAIGIRSLDELIDRTIPAAIRTNKPLNIPDPQNEFQYLTALREIAERRPSRALCGQSSHGLQTEY